MVGLLISFKLACNEAIIGTKRHSLSYFMRQKKKFIIRQPYLKASCLPDDNGNYLRLHIPRLQKGISDMYVCAAQLQLAGHNFQRDTLYRTYPIHIYIYLSLEDICLYLGNNGMQNMCSVSVCGVMGLCTTPWVWEGTGILFPFLSRCRPAST